LVAADSSRALGTLAEGLRNSLPRIDLEVTSPLETSIRKVRATNYHAVLCCLGGPGDLKPVRLLRGERPELPIILLPPEGGDSFGSIPGLEGPTTWVARRDPLVVARQLEQILGLERARRENVALQERASVLRAQVEEKGRDYRRLREESRALVGHRLGLRFAPLVVEDDPDQAELLALAFEKASVPAPVGMVRTGEEAIAYLSGTPPFDDRTRYPVPTLVILDLHLPGRSGLEVLSWIRNSSPQPQLPVVILSSSVDEKDIQAAYGCRANSYLVKPGSFAELVEMARALHFYWASLNTRTRS
jgi:CheY-like chemotaxis protein